jgi:hypothetical protein
MKFSLILSLAAVLVHTAPVIESPSAQLSETSLDDLDSIFVPSNEEVKRKPRTVSMDLSNEEALNPTALMDVREDFDILPELYDSPPRLEEEETHDIIKLPDLILHAEGEDWVDKLYEEGLTLEDVIGINDESARQLDLDILFWFDEGETEDEELKEMMDDVDGKWLRMYSETLEYPTKEATDETEMVAGDSVMDESSFLGAAGGLLDEFYDQKLMEYE